MNIAYALQNVGAVNLGRDVGDTVPVKYSLRGLRRLGHAVTIFALRGKRVVAIEDLDTFHPARELPASVPDSALFQFVESGVRNLQQRLNLPYFAFFDSRRFSDALLPQLHDYDICHEHNGLFSVGAARACARMRMPYVLTFSADILFELDLVGKPLKGIHRRVAEAAARYTFRQADAILCVSRAAKKRLQEHWRVDSEKIHTMPNGVDVDLFKPYRGARSDAGAVITFVGGFQPWHGLDLLIESFVRVLSEFPNARLLLIGDGPTRASVEENVRALGIRDSVEFTGLVPQERVPELLSEADIATIPYPQFPQELWFSPLKLFEYMAAGKAIVASRDGQIAEVIEDHRTGLLFEPGNTAEMTQAILKLLRTPELRNSLAENARQQAVRQHSWDGYVRRLDWIYQQVLKDYTYK